jgi:hypothetical protein
LALSEIPEGFKFPLRLVQFTCRRCASWDAQQTKRSRSDTPPSMFGTKNADFYGPVSGYASIMVRQ